MSKVASEELIETMVGDWYRALDVHAPLEEMHRFLDPDTLFMRFPEADLEGLEGFAGWYHDVTHLFFDEVHEVVSVQAGEPEGDEIPLKVVVHWAASRWNAPAANSDRIDMNAYQSWKVRLDAAGYPRVTYYCVDEVVYNPGSASL